MQLICHNETCFTIFTIVFLQCTHVLVVSWQRNLSNCVCGSFVPVYKLKASGCLATEQGAGREDRTSVYLG